MEGGAGGKDQGCEEEGQGRLEEKSHKALEEVVWKEGQLDWDVLFEVMEAQ